MGIDRAFIATVENLGTSIAWRRQKGSEKGDENTHLYSGRKIQERLRAWLCSSSCHSGRRLLSTHRHDGGCLERGSSGVGPAG